MLEDWSWSISEFKFIEQTPRMPGGRHQQLHWSASSIVIVYPTTLTFHE